MAVSRYVTLRTVKHSGSEFPVGTPMALSDEYATPLLAIGAIRAQAGALPAMPTVPGDVVRETVDTGSGGKARTYVEAIPSPWGLVPAVSGIALPGSKPTVGQEILAALTGPIARDAALIIIGDSTGNEASEWFYLYCQRLLTKLPASVRVEYRLFNTGTLLYDPVDVLQPGAGENALVVGADIISGQPTGRGWAVAGTDVGLLGADRDIKVDCALDSWAAGRSQTLCAQYGNAGQRAWRLYVGNTGTLAFEWKTDGTNGPALVNTAALGWAPGTRKKIRVTLDVDDGAGKYVCKIYHSDDGVTWTQAISVDGAATTQVFATQDQPYEIGSRGAVNQLGAGGVDGAPGVFYSLSVSDVIDGPNRLPVMLKDYLETFGMLGYRLGGPTLRIWNGSFSGSKMSENLARIDRMCPRISLSACVMLNSSHNEGAVFNGPAYVASLASLKSAIRQRIGTPLFVQNTQNPKYAPQEPQRIDAHARRAQLIRELASRQGDDLIDAFHAFGQSPDYVKADGIHPTDETGSPLWADVAWRACGIDELQS